MMISIKDASKLFGISIICFCAVFVCTLFLNYHLDITALEDQLTTMDMISFYNAQKMMSKVIVLISGGCLFVTSLVMLVFYIKHYIDQHKKELGILKALGYSNVQVAKGFWVFGFSVLFGAGIGYGASHLCMPMFYAAMNEDEILPELFVNVHPLLAVCMILVPAIVCAILSVLYAAYRLRCPALRLLKEQEIVKVKKHKAKKAKKSFLSELKSSTIRSRYALVFFIVFASFCFSSMMQMTFSIGDIASVMFAMIIFVIGVVLSCTTMFLAIDAVVKGNTKTIAMMQAFGYSLKDCTISILGGYRPLAYIGFAIGTIYQYVLVKLLMSYVFQDLVQEVPVYEFDWKAFVIVLVAFVLIYEIILYAYTRKIKQISLKEIMLDA